MRAAVFYSKEVRGADVGEEDGGETYVESAGERVDDLVGADVTVDEDVLAVLGERRRASEGFLCHTVHGCCRLCAGRLRRLEVVAMLVSVIPSSDNFKMMDVSDQSSEKLLFRANGCR